MRAFTVTIEWGRRRGFVVLDSATADRAAMAALRLFREKWRGPKPLKLMLTVTSGARTEHGRGGSIAFQWADSRRVK